MIDSFLVIDATTSQWAGLINGSLYKWIIRQTNNGWYGDGRWEMDGGFVSWLLANSKGKL